MQVAVWLGVGSTGANESPATSSQRGLSSIHRVNSFSRALSFTFGSQPKLFNSDPTNE